MSPETVPFTVPGARRHNNKIAAAVANNRSAAICHFWPTVAKVDLAELLDGLSLVTGLPPVTVSASPA